MPAYIHVEGMSQHKRDAFLGTQVGYPVPSEQALDSEDDVLSVRFNGLGRVWQAVSVRHLELGLLASGSYASCSSAAYWDGRNERGERVASGLYYYTLHAGSHRATRRMVVLR